MQPPWIQGGSYGIKPPAGALVHHPLRVYGHHVAFDAAAIRGFVVTVMTREGLLARVGSDVPRHVPRSRKVLEADRAHERGTVLRVFAAAGQAT